MERVAGGLTKQVYAYPAALYIYHEAHLACASRVRCIHFDVCLICSNVERSVHMYTNIIYCPSNTSLKHCRIHYDTSFAWVQPLARGTGMHLLQMGLEESMLYQTRVYRMGMVNWTHGEGRCVSREERNSS